MSEVGYQEFCERMEHKMMHIIRLLSCVSIKIESSRLIYSSYNTPIKY